MNNHSADVGCVFNDITGHLDTKAPRGKTRICMTHSGSACAHKKPIDMLVSGLSCKPVSTMRMTGRWTDEGGPDSHGQAVVYGETLQILEDRDVASAVFEEVLGFCKHKNTGDDVGESKLEWFLARIRSLGKYCSRVVYQLNDTMIEFGRTRRA